MNIGEKLKALRKVNKLNQREMAEMLEISQPFYSALELDKKGLTPKVLTALKEKFNVPDSYFTRSKLELKQAIKTEEMEDEERLSKKNPGSGRPLYKDPSIDRSGKWDELNRTALDKVKRCHNFYKRIVDVKILLNQEFKIKIVGANWGTYENHIMESIFKDEAKGWYRANNSTSDELIAYLSELEELIEFLEVRFFSLFKILYTGIRFGTQDTSTIPNTIE